MIIEARLGTGYGDFVSLLSYVRNCSIKYATKASLVLHFPHPPNFKVSPDDPETVVERVNLFNDQYPLSSDVQVTIQCNSDIKYRFKNMLHEWDPRHGMFNIEHDIETVPNKVLHWSSISNTYYPGHHKDPLYHEWSNVVDNLTRVGYDVVEVTYRTPFDEVLHHLKTCRFGIGYDGMVHQLFKCYSKPLVVIAERKKLNQFLVPHACVITNKHEFDVKQIESYVDYSKHRMRIIQSQYNEFLNEKGNYTEHPLYNTLID